MWVTVGMFAYLEARSDNLEGNRMIIGAHTQ